MPKVRPNPTEEASRVVRACVSGNMALHNISEEQLAVKMGVTKRTIQNWRNDPKNIPVEKLWILAKTLKWTPIQAASVILGRPLTSKEIKEFILM
jgi:transcriptional regulator with XRE-family HTH domain